MSGLKYSEPATGPLVATDAVGSDNVQLLKVVFGDVGEAQRVTPATALPVDRFYLGTQRFDTGLYGPLDATLTLIGPGFDIYVETLVLCNMTEQPQAYSLQNAVGDIYSGRDLDPKEMRVIQMGGIMFQGGIKMSAANADAVKVQFNGVK